MHKLNITFEDADFDDLNAAADEEGMSVQEIIIYKLTGRKPAFTAKDAIERAKVRYGNLPDGQRTFTLPELYGSDWTINMGYAGVFGKRFFKYVEAHPELGVSFDGMVHSGRHAQYKLD